jgi:hypothetical protein
MLGTAWKLYLDGNIELNSGKRLEDYILQNKFQKRRTLSLTLLVGRYMGAWSLGG